jgi:hypothetical protein
MEDVLDFGEIAGEGGAFPDPEVARPGEIDRDHPVDPAGVGA